MTDLSKHRPDFESEFTPQRRAALYAEITETRATGPTRRRGPVVALGVVAAAVTAVALTAPVLVHLNRPGPAPAAQPRISMPATASPTPAASVPPAESPGVQAALTWREGAQVAPSVLEEVAVASTKAVEPAGQGFRHLVEVIGSRGPNNEVIPETTHEIYMDAEGWTWTRRVSDVEPGVVTWLKLAPNEDRELPTDPVELDAVLRGRGGNNSADERVFKEATNLLSAQTRPEVRAAAIRVLQRIAENPEGPGVGKEGVPTNPKVTVTELLISDGTVGYRAHFLDSALDPEGGHSVLINAEGILIGGDQDRDARFSWGTTVTVDEHVAELPQDFVDRLGAERVEMDQPVIEES